MASLTLAPLPKPSKPGKGQGVAALLLGFFAVLGPVAKLAVFVTRLDGGWAPGLVAPWASWWVESAIRPGAGWWILGEAVVFGGIGLLVRRPSWLWLGSFIGLLVTVVYVLLAHVTPAMKPPAPKDLAQASCTSPDSVTVEFYGTPMRFDVWASFGCAAQTDGSHYWMFSRLIDAGPDNTGKMYPLKDLDDGSQASSYSFSPDDPTLNRCYFVGLVPAAERDLVEDTHARHDAFVDGGLPPAVQEVSHCLPPDPEPYP